MKTKKIFSKTTFLATALFIGLGSTPSQAAGEAPQDLAIEGLQKLMTALELFIDAIPQYEAPEILENGDIIIRRVDPEQQREKLENEKKEEERKKSI